jgi:multidrug efflux pump subunit AcrA (membrane-fusion protein)
MIQTPTKTVCPPEQVSEHTIPASDAPVPSQKWRQRKKVIGFPLILLGIILGALLFGPLHWISGLQSHPGPSEAMNSGISALGVLQAPVYNTNFSSAVNGTISDIYVGLGQHVVANQALAHLGNNTYLAQLNQAQVAVDAGHNLVNAAQHYVSSEIRYVHATVVLAVTTYNAELNNRQALIQQANANIAFAKVTLSADQATLTAVNEAANASIAAARATLTTALATCHTAAATPTATSPSTLDDCERTAETTYRAAVTAANVTVVRAQGMVKEDQAALNQAYANANVNIVAVNGRIKEASAGITVAQDDPGIANAYLSLAAAEDTYRIALAALLVAEENVEFTTLRAPHAGVVSAIIGTIGGQPGAVNNLVPAGGVEIQSDHGGLTFIQIVDTANIDEVLSYVDENDIQKIHVGQVVDFTLKANANERFSGSISAIAPNGLGFPTTTLPADSRFPVIISIGNQSHNGLNLYSGMTGTVSIVP